MPAHMPYVRSFCARSAPLARASAQLLLHQGFLVWWSQVSREIQTKEAQPERPRELQLKAETIEIG